eukprot:gene15706-2024_t
MFMNRFTELRGGRRGLSFADRALVALIASEEGDVEDKKQCMGGRVATALDIDRRTLSNIVSCRKDILSELTDRLATCWCGASQSAKVALPHLKEEHRQAVMLAVAPRPGMRQAPLEEALGVPKQTINNWALKRAEIQQMQWDGMLEWTGAVAPWRGPRALRSDNFKAVMMNWGKGGDAITVAEGIRRHCMDPRWCEQDPSHQPVSDLHYRKIGDAILHRTRHCLSADFSYIYGQWLKEHPETPVSEWSIRHYRAELAWEIRDQRHHPRYGCKDHKAFAFQ